MKNLRFLTDTTGQPIQVNVYEICFIGCKYIPGQRSTKLEDFVFEVDLLFKSGISRIVYLKMSELKKIFPEEVAQKSVKN